MGVEEFYTGFAQWAMLYSEELWNADVQLDIAIDDEDAMFVNVTSFADVASNLVFIKEAFRTIISAIKHVQGDGEGHYSWSLIEDGFEWSQVPTEATIDWEAIVAAWADADRLGRLWTILSIDFMRKEVWNEPVTFFAMRAGKPRIR